MAIILGALVLLGALMVGASYSGLLFASPPEGGIVEVHVHVDDRHGRVLFDGNVTPDTANALEALRVAAEEGGFTVGTRETHEFASVVAINGTESNDTHQWTYRWSRDGSSWCWGDRPAADQPLRDGDLLRWVWVEAPVPVGECG